MIRTSDETPQSEHNEHRLRRAFSWLEQSEKAGPDEEKFIFLWIAFNAAYGAEPIDIDEDNSKVKRSIGTFLRAIIEHDEYQKIETILWDKHPGVIRNILNNHYMFKPFWQWVRGEPEGADWRERFEAAGERTERAIENLDVGGVFIEVFRRLYELRNQIFYGGVTFAEEWSRTLHRDGTRIMADIVSVILQIMKADIDANPASETWGKVASPPVNGEGREES